MKKENEAKKEIGKGFIAFANLYTALSIINIYMKEDHLDIAGVLLTCFTFISLYVAGYIFIDGGTKK